jgi:phosphatidylcholine synthase
VGNARVRPILAWGVHLYTALGAVVGVWALLAIAEGAWQRALLLILLGLVLDSTDGMMARALDVPGLIPRFDGRRLDDMVDFLNYVIAPVVFLVATGLLPHWAWASAPVLASAYGFSHVQAKTEDDFFLGFPSYWNVVAVYAWLFGLSPGLTAAIVVGLSVLVLVPLKYVYASRLRVWRRTTYALALLCVLLLAFAVIDPEPARARRLAQISLFFPAWYLLLSFRLGGLHRGLRGRA